MKPLFRTPAFLVVLVSSALGWSSCSPAPDTAPGAAPNEHVAPLTPLEREIAAYDKTAKDFVHIARQKQTGDVSITMRYIELHDETGKAAKKLEAQTSQMSPAQRKSVALITARTAPYLTE